MKKEEEEERFSYRHQIMLINNEPLHTSNVYAIEVAEIWSIIGLTHFGDSVYIGAHQLNLTK